MTYSELLDIIYDFVAETSDDISEKNFSSAKLIVETKSKKEYNFALDFSSSEDFGLPFVYPGIEGIGEDPLFLKYKTQSANYLGIRYIPLDQIIEVYIEVS